MMNIWICIEDVASEFLIKSIVEDIYGVEPQFIESFDYLHRIEDLEKDSDRTVVIVDHDHLSFKGYVVELFVPSDQDIERKKTRSVKHHYIENNGDYVYRLICSLDDIWDDMSSGEDSILAQDYLRINDKHKNLVLQCGTDLYVQESGQQFKKIAELKENKHQELFVKKTESHQFLALLEAYIMEVFAESTLSEKIISAQDLAQLIGIDETTMSKVDSLLDDIVHDLSRIDTIKSFVKKLNVDDSLYMNIVKLTMYMAIHVCKSDQSLNNERNHKKLITAAMFMDLTLKDDELKYMIDLDERFSALHKDERKMVQHHPVSSALMLNRYAQFSQDELLMIERHHEKPKGDGFPKGLRSDNMTALQNLFNTCYRLAHFTCMEARRPGDISTKTIGSAVSHIVKDGFASGPTLKYLSTIASEYLK